MRRPPIPQRIPPLSWRKPALLWTPLALALAIGWPAGLFYADAAPQRLALTAMFAVFALALVTLGASWAMGRAPRSRRIVVLHVVWAGAVVSLLAPYVLTHLLALVADYENAGAGEQFSLTMSFALTPLALVLGLPVALVSGLLFAWVALARRRGMAGQTLGDDTFQHDVQPFR